MTKTIKRLMVSTVLCSTCAVPLVSPATGIPTFDAAQAATAIQQLTQMTQQYEQMVSQYKSLTGIRGFGDLMNNPLLRSYLPQEWQQVYDNVRNGGYESLTNDAKAIRDATAIYSCAGQTGQALSLCRAQSLQPAQNKAFTQQAYTAAMSRVTDIQSLINQISATQDPKGIAELQARLQGENAAIQNEQTKLQLFKMLADTEEKLQQQQQRELSLQQVSKRGRTAATLTPLQF